VLNTYIVEEINSYELCIKLPFYTQIERIERIHLPLHENFEDEAKNTLGKEPSSLTEWACLILNTSNSFEKIKLTELAYENWVNGKIGIIGSCKPPEIPKREKHLNIVKPNKTKKLGNAGSLQSRISIIHSLANIEQCAIDLAWDIMARFSDNDMPKEFFDDFVLIAFQEASHFKMLNKRLVELNSFFGAHSVHNGLWESATLTNDSLMSRLALVHMVHEARGLDVNPNTITKFEKANDLETSRILKIIHQEEISHVFCGHKWFSYCCEVAGIDKIAHFQKIVRALFRGPLKPPFNEEDRLKAGLSGDWYKPISENH